MNYQNLSLFGNSILANANCSKLEVSLLRVQVGLYLGWAWSSKRGKSSHSLSGKLIGLRMGRDFWWVFIGQEISFGLL